MTGTRGWVGGVVVTLVGGVVASGCSKAGSSHGTIAPPALLPAEERTLEDHPGEPRPVEESDLARLEGTRLYVQNPTRGLSVIDVADPDRPRRLTQTVDVVGEAGELYVHGDDVVVVF